MPARLGLWLGLLACFVAAALSDVVSVGLQLPFEDPVRCVTAWQYFHIARVAARFIESSPEWAAKAGAGTSLRLEVLPSADSYQAWQSSVKYALEPEPTCGKNCRVFRAGIVGPFSLEGTQLVSLVTRMAGMMHVPYGAVDEALTIDATSPLALSAANGEVVLPPFFRASHTDSMEVGALYSFIQSSGWRIFTVVHTREQHSSDSATLLADVAQHSTSNPKATVWASISYEPTDPTSIARALKTIEGDVSRVIVLLATSKDAAPFLMRAQQAGMTGKGWTWVGTEWVREFTWVAASMPEFLLNTGVGKTNETIVDAPMETGGEGADRRRRVLSSTSTSASSSSASSEIGALMSAAASLPASEKKAAEMMKKLAADAAKYIRGGAAVSASDLDAAGAAASRARKLAESTWWGLNPNVGAKPVPTGAGKVLAAMNGAVGIVPRRILPNEALAGYLDRFTPDLVYETHVQTLSSVVPPVDTSNGATVFPAPTFPTEDQCYLMNNAPATTSGLPLDLWGPYVFDAVFSIASVVAEALNPSSVNAKASQISAPRMAAAKAKAQAAGLNGTALAAAVAAAAFKPLPSVKFAELNGTYVASLLRNYSQYLHPSMLTNNVPVWMPNGDRYNITLHLVNVQGEKVVPISTWTPAVRPRDLLANEPGKGTLPAGISMTAGNWTRMSAESAIIWPGQGFFPPPDRVVESSHAASIALSLALVGIILSLLLGSVVHHAGITLLPESGVTILVGLCFGLLLRLGFGTSVQTVAGFSESAFMLILLPIIIFESGYSLDKRPFFSQVFSITAYAIFGTVISTLVIGGLIRWAGWGGVIQSLSLEESMSFASLLSATDPVATLAVFSSLKVHPTLYALVYGESVVNDAVAIVLYRTFTNFLVNDITTNAAVYAVVSFLGVLFLSVIVGVIFGALATVSFRYVNVTGQERQVRWERELHAQVDKFKRFIPKMPSLHVDDEEEMKAIEQAYQEEKKAEEALEAAEATEAAQNAAIASSTSFNGATTATTLSKRNISIQGSNDTSKALIARANVPDAADDAAKTTDNVDLMSGVAESAILLLFGYVSFAFAESIYLSGIVASLFCGIAMNLYARRILTRDGKVTSSAIFKMLSTVADTAVFFQIGLNVILTLNIDGFDLGFLAFTLFACLLSRALNIFPISYLLNQYRDDPVPVSFQLAMWYSGLRGAIAYATALGFPTQHRDLIINTTSWVCLFTIFALGGTTTVALDALKIPYNMDGEQFYKDKAARDRAITKAHACALRARMQALSAANSPAAAAEAAQAAKKAEDEDPEAAKLNAADAPVGIELKMSMEKRSKDLMRWVDRMIQKLVYGKVFLREMELSNKISTLKARRQVLASLSLPFPANLQKQLEDCERKLEEGDKGKWHDADDDDDDDYFGDEGDAFEDDSEEEGEDSQVSPRKRKVKLEGGDNPVERNRKKKSAHALKNPTRAPARDPNYFIHKYDSKDRAAIAVVYKAQAQIFVAEDKKRGMKRPGEDLVASASQLAEQDDPVIASGASLFSSAASAVSSRSHYSASAASATAATNPSPAPLSTTSSSSSSSAAGTGLDLSSSLAKAVDDWGQTISAATATAGASSTSNSSVPQPPPGIVSAAAAAAPAPAPAAATTTTTSKHIFGLADDQAAFIASWGKTDHSSSSSSTATATTSSFGGAGKGGRSSHGAPAAVAEPALVAPVEVPGWNAPAAPAPAPAAAPERASPAPMHAGRGVTLKTTPTTAPAPASHFTPEQPTAAAASDASKVSSGPLFTTGATPWRGTGPTPVASPDLMTTATTTTTTTTTPAAAKPTVAANPLFSSPNLPASPAHSIGSVGTTAGGLFLGSPGTASGAGHQHQQNVPAPPTSSLSSAVSAPASPLIEATRAAAAVALSAVEGTHSGDDEEDGVFSAEHSARTSPTAGLSLQVAVTRGAAGAGVTADASRHGSFVSAKGGPTRRTTMAAGAPHLPASVITSSTRQSPHGGDDWASLPDDHAAEFAYDEDLAADTSAHSGTGSHSGSAVSRAGSNTRSMPAGRSGSALRRPPAPPSLPVEKKEEEGEKDDPFAF